MTEFDDCLYKEKVTLRKVYQLPLCMLCVCVNWEVIYIKNVQLLDTSVLMFYGNIVSKYYILIVGETFDHRFFTVVYC